MDTKLAAEAERATLLAFDPKNRPAVNISNLMAESKNYNLNLKDFSEQPVFEMQNIVDFILRKVADCLLYMQIMNKNVF